MTSKRLSAAAVSASRLSFDESALAMTTRTTALGSASEPYVHGTVSVTRMPKDGA